MLLLLLDVYSLLMSIVLPLALLRNFLIASITKNNTANGANSTANRGPSPGFSIVVADQTANNRTTKTAKNRAACFVLSMSR